MTDYVESPIDRIVEVGWSSDLPAVTVSAVQNNVLSWFAGCAATPVFQTKVVPGESFRSLSIFIAQGQKFYDPAKSVSDYYNATYTGKTSLVSWSPSTDATVTQCTAATENDYTSVASTFISPDTFYHYNVFVRKAATFFQVSSLNNLSLGATFPGFVNGESVEVAF